MLMKQKAKRNDHYIYVKLFRFGFAKKKQREQIQPKTQHLCWEKVWIKKICQRLRFCGKKEWNN